MLLASALTLMLTAGAVQAPAHSSPAQPDAASLEKIKQSVLTPPALEVPAELHMLVPEKKKTPTFRLTIEEETPRPPWEEDPVVPLYIRTQRPAYHHEYLMQVTPEAFRSSTLYPGVDILPAIEAFFDGVADQARDRREAQTRRKVRKELERLNWFIPR